MALGIAPLRIGEYLAAASSEAPLFFAADRDECSSPPVVRHAVGPQLRALQSTFGQSLVILHLPNLDPARPFEASATEDELRRACHSAHAHCVFARRELATQLVDSRRSPIGFGELPFGEGHLNPEGHRVVGRALARAVAAHLEPER